MHMEKKSGASHERVNGWLDRLDRIACWSIAFVAEL
ncbi:collagen alpha-2(IV) chain, partial [Trichinella spiralis]